MANNDIDKKTDKKLKPFINALYKALFNENESIKILPDFEEVLDEGVAEGHRNLILKFKGNSYRLSLFSYVRDNGNCLAVRDLDANANLIQLVLDKFCEIKPKGIQIWHNGVITGVSNLNSQELITYISKKVPALVKKEDNFEFIELGMLDNKSAYSLLEQNVLHFISNLLIFSILRKQIKTNYKSDGLKKNTEIISNLDMENELNESLNTILYGPPGTGKTYNTIIKAAKIITGNGLDYKKAKEIYEQLLGDQVEFITFHQNYSYEDFVTGLKPDVKKETLRFVTHEGAFYKICKRARDNFYANKEGLHPTEPSFQKVVFEFLKPLQQEATGIPVKMDVGNSDFTVTGSGGDFLEFKRAGSNTAESLKIDTLKSLYQNEIGHDTEGKHIYYTPLVKHLRALADKLKNQIAHVELKNYVLIIDEINRANISRVFGELITLLEKDKRLGNNHGMIVTLSNGERFSVPKNLYIIGTMNTADKSIALIDIALRRRFVFEPMYPDYSLVDRPYKEFLQSLNEQILEKKNADFLIGHSYLMSEDGEELNFEAALNYKIIPLLNEYFYNHRGISVYALLQEAIKTVLGFEVSTDIYTGVVCKASL